MNIQELWSSIYNTVDEYSLYGLQTISFAGQLLDQHCLHCDDQWYQTNISVVPDHLDLLQGKDSTFVEDNRELKLYL